MEEKTILFVDDDEKTLSALKRNLLDEPYETLFASSGAEALEILKQKQVHVIVADLRMPGMSGLKLLETVKEKHPDVIRMVFSGQPQVSEEEISALVSAVGQGEIVNFISKPWKLEGHFKTALGEAVDYYDLFNTPDEMVAKLAQDDNKSGQNK